MKKYRLIREYPGSPDLGWISNNNWKGYPEFWELVVEKDYEILSYITIESGIIKYKDLDINDDLNCDKYLKIYSVKRNDGEIFTVNDDVVSKTCAIPNKILSIELINNKIRLYPRNSYYNLKDVCKAKQKLFTTEDGVDIFKGDKVYFVNTTNERFNIDICLETDLYRAHLLYFSTKEKAEEYILYNKPLLTLKDIDELLCKNTSSYFLEKFKKRAQKLNNKN